jgi:hypothetical protein
MNCNNGIIIDCITTHQIILDVCLRGGVAVRHTMVGVARTLLHLLHQAATSERTRRLVVGGAGGLGAGGLEGRQSGYQGPGGLAVWGPVVWGPVGLEGWGLGQLHSGWEGEREGEREGGGRGQ